MKRIVNLQTGEITDVELSEEEILEREAKEAYARDILPSILLENLRSVRNKLLAESDWTQSRDVTLENNSEWVTYRQTLRDLPANTEDLENPVWPTKPS